MDEGHSALSLVTDSQLLAELAKRQLTIIHATGSGSLPTTPTTPLPKKEARPKVGCGVIVISKAHAGCVLLGKRKGAAGAGMWALPGGHVEFGESWEGTAARETEEETGLVLTNVRLGTTLNCSRVQLGYHYLVGFVLGEAAPDAVPETREPDKCVSWEWVPWLDAERPEWNPDGLFYALADLRAQGYSPFTTPPPTPSTTEQGTVDASDGAAATPATLSADAVHAAVGSNPLPDWLAAIADSKDTMEVRLREWEDVAWREAHGWIGTDLIHSSSSAVQMLKYYWNPVEQILQGAVKFNKGSESHRGLCHGGSMTSVLDDVLGHISFCAASGPWTGATVKLDISLVAPVKVGSTLLVDAKIESKTTTKSGKEKYKIRAVLKASPAKDATVYATLDGVSINGLNLSAIANPGAAEDAIDGRVWQMAEGSGAGGELKDTGWNM